MFTGLIEAVGEVAEVKPTRGGFRLRTDDDAGAGARRPGDSLAVNGVCLTVVSPTPTACTWTSSPGDAARDDARRR